MLADAMGEFFGARTAAEVRAEMESLGAWSGERAAAPAVDAEPVRDVAAGQLALATWRHLLDRGSLQDGEPYLAGTAPRATARISTTTAEEPDLSTVRRSSSASRTAPRSPSRCPSPRWPTG